EGVVLVGFDEIRRLLREVVGDVFVPPQRFGPARHEADSADAVDDRVGVAGAQLHLQQLRMIGARWLAADLDAVAHGDRIIRIERHHAMVLDEDAGDAVAGRGHDKALAETDLEWAGLNVAVPIDFALWPTQTQVPLADGGGSI